MIYMLTEVVNFRARNFRIFLRELVIDFKQPLHGSWLRKLTPPPITPTPLALRRWGGFALARPTSLTRLTATVIGGRLRS